MEAQTMNTHENIVFALDIGTRSIVGILGNISQDKFTTIDFEQRFHQKRAMRDGQIEDIQLVVKTVTEVKEALEERNGIKLTSASIAAAGRSLKTMRSSFEQELNEEERITPELLHSLEYNAISNALDNFSTNEKKSVAHSDSSEPTYDNYSCVGYNVIHYLLDGYPLTNPLGHKGNMLKLELIAAFLPFSVTRSLYSVTELCGLSVESLTLEPIAAINAVVPPDVRLLNIAIADIGAGTSDIGISKNGSIIAYDMVTIAGDEITEMLMREYLVDFDTAENIKRDLSSSSGEISFTDILGVSYSYPVQTILGVIDPTIERLSKSIAESIIKVNDGPPTALFLVGGGSQIPNLCAKTALNLKIPEQRVTLGGKYPYKNISLHTDKLLTPEFVTPIGIGATSRLTHIHDLFSVTVNGEKITLPGTETVKVLDALLLAGIKASNLIGLSATPLIYFLNGEKCVARGTTPSPGEIRINGEVVALDNLIRQGDAITVTFATHGEKPIVTLEDLCGPFGELSAKVNGNSKPMNYEIQNGDHVEVFYGSQPVDEHEADDPEIDELEIDDSGIDESESDKDDLAFSEAASVETPPSPPRTVRVCINSNWVEIPVHDDKQLIFVDMLNYVDINTKRPDGELILSINNRIASYTDRIMDGDAVEIRWSKSIIS